MQRVRSGVQSRAQKGGESATATQRIKISTQEARPVSQALELSRPCLKPGDSRFESLDGSDQFINGALYVVANVFKVLRVAGATTVHFCIRGTHRGISGCVIRSSHNPYDSLSAR
jgi:hypothetical protein